MQTKFWIFSKFFYIHFSSWNFLCGFLYESNR